MVAQSSLVELKRNRDELEARLAEKEAEITDLRSRRNALQFAIGLLETPIEGNSPPTNHRKFSFR